MKGAIYTYDLDKEGLELKPGSIIRVINSKEYPEYIGILLLRVDDKFKHEGTKIPYVCINNGLAYSTLEYFEWEIIREI